MKTRFAWLALALGFGMNLRAEDLPGKYWVNADQALIRKEPKAGAVPFGSLTAGVSFQSKRTLLDWVYVDTADGDSIGGWIHNSLVTDTLINEQILLNRIGMALDLKDSLKWTERLVSMQPRKMEYVEALQSAYAAKGEMAKAAAMGRRLRGTEEAYLARFEGDELVVIGILDSNGEFRNLLWETSETEGNDGMRTIPNDTAAMARKRKALDLRIPLTAKEWFPLGENIGAGRRFHTIRISKVADFDASSMGTFGLSFGSALDVFKKTYGNTFFATQRMYNVPFTGIRRKAEWDSLDWYRQKLVGKAFDSTGTYSVEFRSLEEYGFVDVSVTGGATPHWHRAGVWSQRGIFDRARKQVWPPEDVGGNETFEFYEKELVPKTPPRWFRFGNSAEYPAFIILPFSTDHPANFRPDVGDYSRFGNYGFQLIRVRKNGFKAFLVLSRYAGC